VEDAAERLSGSRWGEGALRVGMASRGLVFLLLAYLVARVAMGVLGPASESAPASLPGVPEVLAARIGHPVIAVLAVGLALYALSSAVDAILHHNDESPAAKRWGIALLGAGALFVPALLTADVWAAVALLFGASVFLGAANPPLDAARLDIIHPAVWGRAESIRTMLRSGGDAVAPLLFGVLADSVFGGSSGLQYTFLLMLGSLFIAAAITLVFSRRTYPGDVVAAAESVKPAHAGSGR
jgi:hypothetical protein